MKKIIIPVDFSKHSEFALKAASKFAKKYDLELLALHMLQMPDIMLTESGGEQSQKTAFFLQFAQQRFTEFLEKDYLDDIKVTPIIKHFKVFREVNDVAKDHEADLIVMGSHGASGLQEFFVGSNTERVVRHSNIPVLVVKGDLDDINFDTIAFACDFSPKTVKPFLKALEMFSNTDSKIYPIHVNLPGAKFKSTSQIQKRVADFYEKAKVTPEQIKNTHCVADFSIEAGILNTATKIEADLIIVPTHGRKGLAHFFEGSIGEDLVNHASLPVMTFKI